MQVPASLLQSLQQNIKGFNREAFEMVHAEPATITSIRLNSAKVADVSTLFSSMNETGKEMIDSAVPWSSDGYYLSSRPSFTADPLFHAGAYYVQEASSMFLEQAVKQSVDLEQPLHVLDLCAAPGGKSTLLQSLISPASLLVSNEVIKGRVTVLAENITKWGAANVIVTNNDPKDFQRLPGYFDLVVVDAPCSGSGLFRKDANAINEWSEQNVELCSQRQQRILADILPALKDGGVLIYSTCSFSPEEDEAIADWLVNDQQLTGIRLAVNEAWNITETNAPETSAYGYRFFPDQLKGEGFYIAAFKKSGSPTAGRPEGKSKKKSERLTDKEATVVQPWLKNPAGFFFIKQQEEVLALPVHAEKPLTEIQSALYIKKAGIKLGTIIRNELIPSHELALGNIIHTSVFRIEVDRETALQYLRRQDIKLEAGITGWALLTYRQLPLGWVKILPNRINNYYPKEWRILNK